MIILVDCTPLSCGGGIQVAIAFLINLNKTSDVIWRAVVPEALGPFFPLELRSDSRVIFLPKKSHMDRISLRNALRKLESAISPDVVFTVFGASYFRARAPHVVGFALPNLIYGPIGRPTLRRSVVNWLHASSLRTADLLVVETETVRRRLAARLGFDPSRIAVIGNSVNPLLLIASAAAAPMSGRFRILIPSSYYTHKNLEITPAVAAVMRRVNPDLDFEFQFTLDPSSNHWKEIMRLAARLGVAHYLVTLGVLPLARLAGAYRDASAVFLPTLLEASTAVYPESFYMKRPLVTSNMDFALELCGDAALFAPPRDADALARQLIHLAQNRELRERLIAAGERQLALNYPGPDEKFAMQMEALKSAIETRKPSSQI